MKCIKKRILMILMLLIFFTSLGSAVAVEDNDLSDLYDSSADVSSDFTDMELSTSDDDSIISDEGSTDSSDDVADGVIIDDSTNADFNIDDSDDSIADISDVTGKKESKNILGSTEDPIIIKNGVISSSSSLLTSPQTIVIKDAKYYNGSINTYVQKIIDDAAAGSTIKFTGSSYENIYLKISKPLNIISKSGTSIKNLFNIPVFTILEGGSGTNISGFTVDVPGSFVDASHVSKIGISGNKISTKRTAIVLDEVYDSVIKGNLFSSFNIAIDISNSGGISISKNNITPKGGNNIGIHLKDISSKKGINITDNNIIGSDRRIDCTGIFFDTNAANVLIKNNMIRQWYTGIDFPNSISNVSILNNTISDNGDGVVIAGWINGFTFNKNIVTGNGRMGVLFGYDFKSVKSNFTLEKNFFSYNGGLDLKNQGDEAVTIGENFAKNRCVRVGMKYGLNILSRQSGSKYYFSVVDRFGRAVSGLPNFSATFNIGGRSYTVNFIDSVAFIDVGSNGAGNGGSGSSLNIGEDNRGINDWGQFKEVDAADMDYYEQFYKELLNALMSSEFNNSSNDDSMSDSSDNGNNDPSQNTYQNDSGSSYHSGTGSGDSGVSSGSYSVNSNGVMSGSSGSASASASPSAAASPSSNVPESASVKTLSVDEETFRVIGVSGLVLLIILVIGLYYREDIKDMME